jgi:hypothetical protein
VESSFSALIATEEDANPLFFARSHAPASTTGALASIRISAKAKERMCNISCQASLPIAVKNSLRSNNFTGHGG